MTGFWAVLLAGAFSLVLFLAYHAGYTQGYVEGNNYATNICVAAFSVAHSPMR